MPFGRRPDQAEQNAAKAASQASPNNINQPERGVVRLRRDMSQLAKMNAAQLRRMRSTHDKVGAAALEASLGTPDYTDFVADFNALRAAVLQMSPDLADIVPDAL